MSLLHAIVVGGGAAGFFGAIACAAVNPKMRVTLIEANHQPLSKVRISGGGRCNVTHACFDPALLVQHYPRGGKALRGAFTRFQPRDTVQWFEHRGVELKTEADGRMFPTTDNSTTIVQCLIQTAQAAGVAVRTGTPAIALERAAEGFIVELKNGERLRGDRLLLATGSHSRGHRWAEALGHQIQPPVPSLFTFNIASDRLRELAGVSVERVRVRLPAAKLEQEGALLIAHWGMSGPAILKLSAWGARTLHDCGYQTPLMVNWLPEENAETLRHQLQRCRDELASKSVATWCPLNLPKRLWQFLLTSADIDLQKRWAELPKKTIDQLAIALTQSQYQISGKGVFKEEFVTCGGVSLKDVDFKTMQSRRCPHLYFAGEILDIDGVTGGFNFQSAWTTGWIAGRAMAE